MGDPSTFEELLIWAYRGERSGETLFAELSRLFAAEHRPKLETLSKLERAMGDALVPLLARHGVDGGDDQRSSERGKRDAAGVASMGWQGFLAQFGPVTDDAIARYRDLAGKCPDPGNPVLQLLVAHEEALQAFGVSELQHSGDDSLASVNEVLGYLAAAT